MKNHCHIKSMPPYQSLWCLAQLTFRYQILKMPSETKSCKQYAQKCPVSLVLHKPLSQTIRMPNMIYRMEAICSQKAAVRHKTENHSQNPEDNKMSATLYAKERQFYNSHILPTAILFEFGTCFTKNNYFPYLSCMVEPWSNQIASLFHERKKSVERISSVSLYLDKRSL